MEQLIISLTSYPARIMTVHKVIESLFEQTEKATEIILWLSEQEFPQKYENLPESLNCLIGKNGFRIEWVYDNLKSHKKYFYALQNSNSVVITVDDDMYYSRTMVQTLMDSYRKHPTAISARNVHIIFREGNSISPYLTWESYAAEYIDKERMDLCGIGVNAILYPPGCANDRWFDKESIKSCAENQDDLWLKYNEIIDNIPVVYTGMKEEDFLIQESQNDALYIQNTHGGENDNCINKLVDRMQNSSWDIYENWLDHLMSLEEYIFTKKRYYMSKFEEIFTINKKKNVYICGAGKYAHILLRYICRCGYGEKIKAFLVSSENNDTHENDVLAVKLISELKENQTFSVICGVSEKYREEIKQELENLIYLDWIEINLQEIVRLELLEERYDRAR